VKLNFKTILPIIIFLFVAFSSLYSGATKFEDLKIDDKKEYIFRLVNGDEISGAVIGFEEDEVDGAGLKIKTELGNAYLFESQIKSIYSKEEYYRHSHRVFMLPTAEPIGDNHFVGNVELAMLYAGFGVGDIVSITAGSTIIPFLPGNQQAQLLNLKTTILKEPFESMDGHISVALGANLGFLNSNNRFVHYYGVASFMGSRSRITTAVFYKAGSRDFYDVRVRDQFFFINYPDGGIGIALGLETKFSHWNGVRFIGELWNSDLTRPSNTGVFLGFRLSNTRLSADFGLAFFTQPLALPFFSFAWTPFD